MTKTHLTRSKCVKYNWPIQLPINTRDIAKDLGFDLSQSANTRPGANLNELDNIVFEENQESVTSVTMGTNYQHPTNIGHDMRRLVSSIRQRSSSMNIGFAGTPPRLDRSVEEINIAIREAAHQPMMRLTITQLWYNVIQLLHHHHYHHQNLTIIITITIRKNFTSFLITGTCFLTILSA